MKNTRRFGFTIVELLVVISIIAVLFSLLLSGLNAASATGRKTKEMNRLKQVLYAWLMYSGQYEDKLLPGFLEQSPGTPGVQTAWNVHYKNQAGAELLPEFCQTYPWRLAGYMDYSYDVLLGYRLDSEASLDVSSYAEPYYPPLLPASLLALVPSQGQVIQDGRGVALQPAFGYNAFYLGGWWTMPAGSSIPKLTFGDDRVVETGTTGVAKGRIVANSLGAIQKPSDTIAFTGSIFLNQSAIPYSKIEDFEPGSAWVVPHRLGQTEIWGFGGVVLEQASATTSDRFGTIFASIMAVPEPVQQSSNDIGKLLVFQNQSVPFDRYGKSVAIGLSDGSVKSMTMKELNDIRLWIPAANTEGFSHSP